MDILKNKQTASVVLHSTLDREYFVVALADSHRPHRLGI